MIRVMTAARRASTTAIAVRRLVSALLLFWLCLAGVVSAQSSLRVETTLDRTEIERGETVTFVIRVFGQQGGLSIDLEPLRSRFEIVSTRSTSHLLSVNNRVESRTDYTLTLFPRELGEQEIPSISVGGTMTDAYTLTVNPPSTDGLGNGRELFLETVLNKDSVYVQEQVLFTIRLYYTISGIRNPVFTEIEPDSAVVQLLGQPHQYEQLIDGVRYGIYEKNYAIFPQRSGEIAIPDIVFRGELTDGSSSLLFRNPNTQPITAFAEGYNITVHERPAAFPADSTWLPATQVTVSEQWDRDITQLEPGDSVRRTISVTALGLDGAALPPLESAEIERMNVYPDPPRIDRMIYDGHVMGSRVETSTLVATEEGSVVIPEITLPWWDVDNDSLQTAVIPASFIRVNPVGGIPAQPDASASDAPADLFASADELLSAPQTPTWILNLMALAIAMILGFMWWIWRRQQARVAAIAGQANTLRSAAYARDIADGQEAQTFKELEASLKDAPAEEVRIRLIAWGRQFFNDAGLYNLQDLTRRINNTDVAHLTAKLQASLYGGASANQFDGADRNALLSALGHCRTQQERLQQQNQSDETYGLPPLYPH